MCSDDTGSWSGELFRSVIRGLCDDVMRVLHRVKKLSNGSNTTGGVL
jgi:hypothetical protein